MYFLDHTIFDRKTGKLLACKVAEIMNEYTARAADKILLPDELKYVSDRNETVGFRIDSNGVLLSDCSNKLITSKDNFDVILQEAELKKPRSLDLTDIVLMLVQYNAFIIVNYDEALNGEEPITIPAKSLKVSKTTFNITGSYKLPEGGFRTFSLLKVEDASPIEFYAGVHSYEKEFDIFGDKVSIVKSPIEDCSVLKVNAKLEIAPTSLCGTFINYCSFNRAKFDVAIKCATTLHNSEHPESIVQYKTEQVKSTYEHRSYSGVVPQFKHTHDRCMLQQLASNPNLEKEVKEAMLTVQWTRYYLSKLSKKVNGSETEYINFINTSKKLVLKFDLELMSNRYYLSNMSMFNMFDKILEGGGVPSGTHFIV